ncbi:hypothetical protein T4D_8255 [Trichinella pseudospiralis]|uniref:Uncharacterized protein n=1 Tax=Trichinella pseudospiralis TaxID=6337 RepID=A0A0V1FUX4_TRIPS|nr:hypothetical protein T4D_8255 [Trichinella pseudospiralis]
MNASGKNGFKDNAPEKITCSYIYKLKQRKIAYCKPFVINCKNPSNAEILNNIMGNKNEKTSKENKLKAIDLFLTKMIFLKLENIEQQISRKTENISFELKMTDLSNI